MQWQIIVALVVMVPVVLAPVVFIWFLNFSGLYSAMKRRRARHTTLGKAKAEVHID
jgi:Tfp pilus assembly protein PilO